MALVETFSYLVLFYFWVIGPDDNARRVVGTVHGLVWLAFVAMVVPWVRDSAGSPLPPSAATPPRIASWGDAGCEGTLAIETRPPSAA